MRHQLEERLIVFAGNVAQLSESLLKKPAGAVISSQILRSSIAVALNYGEAQGAESRKDFIHKLRIGLKELRETSIALQLIKDLKLHHRNGQVTHLLEENNELISIFVSSIKTANKNLLKEKLSKKV